MVSKTITVTEEVYGSLKTLKREHESFSHLFKRLAGERSIADKYFGILGGENVMEARESTRKARRELSDDFLKIVWDNLPSMSQNYFKFND